MSEAPVRDTHETSTRWWLATPGWQRWVVLAACALAVAALIGSDGELRRCYRALVGDPPTLAGLAYTATKAMHPGLVFLMVCGACLAMWDRWREMAKAMCAGIAIQAVGIAVLKDLIGRERPGKLVGPWAFNGPEFGTHSMPSGHAGLAFVLAAVLSGFFPRCRWLFYPIAAVVALARVHADRHFFSDAVAGAIIGILVGQWMVWRFRRAPDPVPERDAAPLSAADGQTEPTGPPL
ncbi:MAG: phosphatase PAP2 family protein [Armatimonadota bacterium]